MKKLLIVCLALSIFACKEEPKNYATLSGKIENPHESKTLKIFKGREYEKLITLEEDGTFKDTLNIVEGDYTIQHGNKYGEIYLKNDNETTLNTDYEDFDKSIVFGGDGSDINNFSMQSFLISNDHFTEELMTTATKESMNEAIKNYKLAYNNLKTKYKNIDSTHLAKMDNNIKLTSQQIQQYLGSKIEIQEQFPVGTPSPSFEGYENFKGSKMALSDLKGKYVYMDIWATWCGPCIQQIPSLQKVEKQFEGKNIEFVSISIDEGRGYQGNTDEAYKGWRKMVAEKNLGGIQLLANNGFNSQFIRDYRINGIPRFILVDPSGNIVNPDAPRPSSPALVDLFNSLDI